MFRSERRNAEAARSALIDALIATLRSHGDTIALDDIHRRPVTRRRLLFGAALLGRALARGTEPGDRVGLAGDFTRDRVLALVGLVLFGRIPVLLSADQSARGGGATLPLTRLVVSRALPAPTGPWPTIMIEDVRESLTSWDSLRAAMDARQLIAGRWRLPGREGVAAIGFSDVGHDLPQGELLRDAERIAGRIEPSLGPGDVVYLMEPLPARVGLSAGLLPGLLKGACVVLGSSNLPLAANASLINGAGATVLIANGEALVRLAPMHDALRAGGLRAVIAATGMAAAAPEHWCSSGIEVIDVASADAGREVTA